MTRSSKKPPTTASTKTAPRGKKKTDISSAELPLAGVASVAPALAAAAVAPAPPDKASSSVADLESTEPVQQALLWSGHGWTAKVIKNEEDDGWAVAMTLDGEAEPALVGPWTMGRDKKNPKPLDAGAFATLVKTASEVIRRHEQQAHAALHKSVKVATPSGRVRVALDIIPDEDEPYAELSAYDDTGAELARYRVAANYRFTHDTASAWVHGGFAKPGVVD